jgi:quercetin dioxygenase-like cupin family protein
MFTRILGSVMLATLALTPASGPALAQDPPKRKVTVTFDHVLPNVPGKSMKGVLVEYGPGGSSRSHRHPASAFIYATVLEGAIRSQVNDGPEKVYRAGESWVEQPGDHHRVSANASDTEPAKLLAVFVVDTGETKIVIDDAQ